MPIITRFAPSPTGVLHIGGARTALFNWLYARHHRGTFRLRIEDTDHARSTDAAVTAILDGLSWLGIDWDGEPIVQSQRAERHVEVVNQLLRKRRAYRCYRTPEELETMRHHQRSSGIVPRSPWRPDAAERLAPPAGINPVIRLASPVSGETVIHDLVQGVVRVANAQLDDLVLLRSDGTPTYNLAVVVDDHDMDITQVIRGDDHLNNAFRQIRIYRALGWEPPQFAHVPLIHGADGAKLAKRHGALGVEEYRTMGYLPEALRNYLLRLGWAHGDAEIISSEQAIQWFDVGGIGRSPARLDFAKLDSLNAHYIRAADDDRLVDLIAGDVLSEKERLRAAMPSLKSRAKTITELTEKALFYSRPVPPDEKTAALLSESRDILKALVDVLRDSEWTAERLEETVRALAQARGLKLSSVAQPLRAAVTGRLVSPPVFEAAAILGHNETLARLIGCCD